MQQLAVEVRTVAYSHDGLSIISDHNDNIIQCWDSSTGASRSVPSRFTLAVWSFALSPNGHWFANGCEDGNIRLKNVRTDVVERVLLGSSFCPTDDMSFSRCGRWLISWDHDGVTRLWDLKSTDDQGKVEGERYDVHRSRDYVVFSPVGDQVAVGFNTMSSRLCLFDTRATDLRQPLKEVCLSDTLHSMDYSTDGQRPVLGTDAFSVLLWDPHSDKPDVKLEGHTDAVYCVAYSPCGKWILSGSRDKTAHLWLGEVDNWFCVAVVRGCSEAVTSVAWNPVVPMEFVTGSNDGSVRVWRISRGEAGDVWVRMHWGSHIGQLCASDLTFTRALGLSSPSQRLLVQRGAVDETLSSGKEGSSGREIEQKE